METTSSDQSLCLPYDEAIKVLPKFVQGDDDKEKQDVAMFLKQVDQLHKHKHKPNVQNDNFNAALILAYVGKHFVDFFNWYDVDEEYENPSEEFVDQLIHITAEISTKVASDIINGTDLHNITLKVLTILQHYSWEVTASLSIATYILTFGDYGLSMCPKSKVFLKKSSDIVRQMVIVLPRMFAFERLPIVYMTSQKQDIKVLRTCFIVGIYWIIRLTVTKTASHIMRMPGLEDNVDITTSQAWDDKLDFIKDHLTVTYHQLRSLLEVERGYDDYTRIKEAFHQKNHSDNMKILHALFNPVQSDYADLLLANKWVHVRELKGKNVLLLISGLDINPYEFDTIKDIYIESKKKFDFEMVWIPIVDNYTYDQDSMYNELTSSLPWHCLYYPRKIREGVKRFLREDCKFEGEPMIVMLDPRGKVVNQNAVHTMLIWHHNSVPFTSTREETLLEQETWRLELMANGIDQQLMDWIGNEKYIFLYGGGDIDWIRNFTRMVREVAKELLVPIEMVYVGSNNSESQEHVSNIIKVEKLSHCFSNHGLWYFKRRKDTMIQRLIQHEKFDNIVFQEILRLDNHIKSDVEWAIFAKGSRILINGHGEIVLSTLQNFRIWKEKASSAQLGLGMEFQRIYQEFYLEKYPVQRMEFLTHSVKVPTSIPCSICHDQMQNYNAFICSHPSLKNQSSSTSFINYPPKSDLFSPQPTKDSSIKEKISSHIIYYPSSYPRLT